MKVDKINPRWYNKYIKGKRKVKAMNMDWVYQIVNKEGRVFAKTENFFEAQTLYWRFKAEGYNVYVKPVRK